MASYYLIMNQIDIDSEFYVWGSGQDLRRFDGNTWEYYNYSNSAVPSGAPYFLDTRSISIDPEDRVWVGCAEGPTSGLNENAVFYIDSNDVSIGDSWTFSDLGSFTEPQEISHIYACPYGDDILAFATPLNGIGGTGTTGYTQINGVTGGRLFYYLIETEEWRETVPGYAWPHIYDIIAKGYDGKDYFYYVATSEGLFTIPQGTLEKETLLGGFDIIKQAQVYNTKTSGIISDNIYSIDLDEDGNLWIGTDVGLSFFDGTEFYNYPVATGPVTKVKSRPNGHVFFSSGDGELNLGTGLWHFNGVSFTQHTSAVDGIANDNVLDIKLVEHNITQNNSVVYEDGLWVLCYNYLSDFDYDIPHVYGSSKYEGATGWNFTYFTPDQPEINPAIPKINKYTWEYPEWRNYQDEFLKYKFPGLDPRNLFLTTELSDIADGRAGKQPYWDNWPIPSYEEEVLVESIADYNWADNITIGAIDSYGATGAIYITSSASIKTQFGTKYYVGGYITGNTNANFGYYNNNDIASLSNQNPTLGGRATNIVPSTSTSAGSMGFITCYNEKGIVDSILPFRGHWTTIEDLAPSPDGSSIVATGQFKRFIENGDYVWDSIELLNDLFEGGPTGAPIGVTNPYITGLTSGSYTWIYDPASPVPTFSDTWSFNTVNPPSSGNFDMKTLNSSGLYQDVTYISINYTSFTSGNISAGLDALVTGNTLRLYWNSPSGLAEAYYRIDRISTFTGGLRFNVTYMSGATGTIGNFVGAVFVINGYDYTPNTYPMVRNLQYMTNTLNQWEIGIKKDVQSIGLFVTKINGDLGGVSSLAPLINYDDYNSAARKYFRTTGFRHFPRAAVMRHSDGDKQIKLDVTRYSINLIINNSESWNSMDGSPLGGFATLKNLWNRTNDGFFTTDYIAQSNRNTLYAFNQDTVFSYVRLSVDDFSLLSTITSESLNFTPVGALKIASGQIGSVKSLRGDNTTLVTGYVDRSFTMGGIEISATGSDRPYYIIMNKAGVGVTGALISDGYSSGAYNLPAASKDDSTYYVTTIFGGSGSYFGNAFVAGSTGTTYLLTANITEQAVSKSIFSIDLDFENTSYVNLNSGGPILDDQYYMIYGISLGAAGVTGTNIIKTNRSGKILDGINFGGTGGYNHTVEVDAFSANCDAEGNLFVNAVNRTGVTGSGYYQSNPKSAFSLLTKQYQPELGINLGNIISRPGSGAWTWCDVHSTDMGMQVPILSTVVFNNYASNLYGKQNNNWILSDSKTGDELLNVKGSPYFIYTFSIAGNFTIYNSVEDSMGNVYMTAKPGYIEVIDHKIKRPDDKNPDEVDSFDYGQPEPFYGRDYQAQKLAKDMMIEQESLFRGEQPQFGSEVVIPNNPDATFRTD